MLDKRSLIALQQACLERRFWWFNTSRVATDICPSHVSNNAICVLNSARSWDGNCRQAQTTRFRYHYNDEVEAQSLEWYVPDDGHPLPLGRVSRDFMIACFCDYQHAKSFWLKFLQQCKRRVFVAFGAVMWTSFTLPTSKFCSKWSCDTLVGVSKGWQGLPFTSPLPFSVAHHDILEAQKNLNEYSGMNSPSPSIDVVVAPFLQSPLPLSKRVHENILF
jgi:hypothetical protein